MSNEGGPLHRDAAYYERKQAEELRRIRELQERQTLAAELQAGALAELAHRSMPDEMSVGTMIEEWRVWLREFERAAGRKPNRGVGETRTGP
jgi:hypothetical protein